MTSGQNVLTNLRTIEKIVVAPETNKNLEFGEEVDWEKVLREHRERIEKEENDKMFLRMPKNRVIHSSSYIFSYSGTPAYA